VRPGHHVGRRSFHEIVLSNPLHTSDAALRSLLTALFAQALRCDRFGIEPRDAVLRIAYGRLDTALLPIEGALDRLVDALDDAPAIRCAPYRGRSECARGCVALDQGDRRKSA
jgi:hypothetical protein